MDIISDTNFSSLSPSKKIIYVLKSNESFGGPQSASQLQKTLNMKRKNLDSLLSKLFKKGAINRISPGVYAYPSDKRSPKE
tara:strand:- start:2424 stop:2666 length:243 start_codon:yes stop_codon:yes gene_type:complete